MSVASSQLLYLPVYLIQRRLQYILQPRPPMVSEVAGKYPRFFKQHTHVAQLRELRFGHLTLVSQDVPPFSDPVLLSLAESCILT
jgi:hypothetical protein